LIASVDCFGRYEELAARRRGIFGGAEQRAAEPAAAVCVDDDEQPHERAMKKAEVPREEAGDDRAVARDKAAALPDAGPQNFVLPFPFGKRHVDREQRREIPRACGIDCQSIGRSRPTGAFRSRKSPLHRVADSRAASRIRTSHGDTDR